MVILATILVQMFRKLLYSGTKSTSSRHMSDTFGSSKKCMSCFFIKSCLKESDSNDNLYVIGFAICMGSGVRFLHKWTGLQHSCHRMTVYHQSWLSISLHPYYIPKEFPRLFYTLVYIHPRANAKSAALLITVIHKLDAIFPDTPLMILNIAGLPGYLKAIRNTYSAPPHRGVLLSTFVMALSPVLTKRYAYLPLECHTTQHSPGTGV